MPHQNTNTAATWAAITPSDTETLDPIPRAVFVGTAGTITAVGADGVSAPFAALAGQELSIQPSKIMATGTTASGLVALY